MECSARGSPPLYVFIDACPHAHHRSMTPAEVADVEGILLIAGLLTLVIVALASIGRARRARLRSLLDRTGTLLAAGVAAGATGGSLWFSEVAGFPPCDLCWYQRIAMYPLFLVLGLAALRPSRTARLAGLTLALTGLTVSAWHNLIETFPTVGTGGCDPANPCTLRWVEGLAFWTIPRMAAASFVLIIALTIADPLTASVQED